MRQAVGAVGAVGVVRVVSIVLLTAGRWEDRPGGVALAERESQRAPLAGPVALAEGENRA